MIFIVLLLMVVFCIEVIGNIWLFDKGSYLVCGMVSCGILVSVIISKVGK